MFWMLVALSFVPQFIADSFLLRDYMIDKKTIINPIYYNNEDSWIPVAIKIQLHLPLFNKLNCIMTGDIPFEYLCDIAECINTHPAGKNTELTPSGWKRYLTALK
jgi:hypothetical protein